MAVDVGRLVWARTQIQAAVDSAALAAAQSMPDTANATSKANEYWNKNNGFIQSQGTNVQFSVTFPPGNKALSIHGQADIPTWFAKFFGISKWTVSADGDAASQVLDISVVLDISGSMCWGSYPPIDKGSSSGPFGPYVGPGANAVTLTSPIAAGGGGSININVNSTAIFNSTSSSTNNTNFGYSTTSRYYQYTPSNGRQGAIKIDNEVFLITAIPNGTTLTVTRAQANNFLGTSTTKDAHASGTKLYAQRSDCLKSAPSAAGPYDYFDGMIDDAKYFVTLFNSSYDHIGLVDFSSDGNILRNLTGNFSQIQSDMDAIAYPNGGTNSAHGIAVGRQVVTGSGSRSNSTRVMVFLTDGRANSYCGSSYNAANYNTTTCPSQGGGNDGNASAVNAAYAEATRAAGANITIYTIGFGPYVDDAFLTTIATSTGGKYFKAPTLADLDAAFTSIAAETHISLTK